MSRYRKIETRIWDDDKFKQLSPGGQRFFLYLLTSPHSSAWGAYVLDDLYIVADLNISIHMVRKLWGEVKNIGLVLKDDKTRVVFFPNWFRYNLPANEKTATACIRGILDLPRSEAWSEFVYKSEWVKEKLANSKLTISEPESKGERMSTEQEQEQRALSIERARVDESEKEPEEKQSGKSLPQKEETTNGRADANSNTPQKTGHNGTQPLEFASKDSIASVKNLVLVDKRKALRKFTGPQALREILKRNGVVLPEETPGA